MKHRTALVVGLALLGACQNDHPAARRPSPNSRRAQSAASHDVPVATPPSADDASVGSSSEQTDGGGATRSGVEVFRLGDSTCSHDPSRNSLGAGTHGFFNDARLEMEVRNIRYSCTPVPVYTAELEGTLLHLRYSPAERAAITRCNCRHDQFLQVTGVPNGEYSIRVEELLPNDGGSTVIATGHIDSTPTGPAAGSTAAPAEAH